MCSGGTMVVIAILIVVLQLLLSVDGKHIKCGVSKVFPKEESEKQMYMFNGNDAALGMFPWVGYLVYNNSNGYAECTASLIRPRVLVTAAHCIINECAKWAYMILGAVKREDVRDKHVYKVAQFLYPKMTYFLDGETFPVHDIALIKLERDVDISGSNGTINTICLPKRNQVTEGTLYLSGWGLTAEDAKNPADTLKYITAEVNENFRCYKRDKSKFCVTTDIEKKQQPWKGDSGSPAQMLVKGKYYLQGALSSGRGKLSLYSPIQDYIEWVRTHRPEQSVDEASKNCKPKKSRTASELQ